MTHPMNDALTALFLHCQGIPRDEVAELIRDTAYGEHPLNPTTRHLLKGIFDLMPEPDNFTTPELAQAIEPHAPDIAQIVMGSFAGFVEARYCPGHGESCGNPLSVDNDLCSDCGMARLDAQSPRIPR